jgi:hypothetical protein
MEDQLISPTLLAAAGINISDDEIVAFVEQVNDELDERVGQEVTESLDDEHLAALVELQEKGTDEELAIWLEANVSELQQIIEDERDILLGEIAENAGKFTSRAPDTDEEDAA